MLRSVCLSGLCAIFLLVPCSMTFAQQMRMETHVFVDDETEPADHTITLFDANTVYQFSEQPAQITVFRAPTSAHGGQFILLDLESNQRTDISTKRIGQLMDKINKWAGGQEDPLLKFSADPTFVESFDDETGTLTLDHPVWQYRAATVPAENKQVLAHYREFTDWFTRLNTMLHSTLPPGARLKLNAACEAHGVVPVEIHRTVKSQSVPVRSTHLFAWRLSREDRDRIDETQSFLASFEKVGNKDFLAQRAERDLVRGQSR